MQRSYTDRSILSVTDSAQSPLERRLERAISPIVGEAECSVMVSEDADGTAVGALIVVKAPWNASRYLQLQRALKTLLKLDIDGITIIMEEGTGVWPE